MRRYSDPLDVIWLDAVRRLGWQVQRSTEVYASWDGQDTLRISVPDDFDPDDCLAQMLLHEICHALVSGRLDAPDWGMENIDDRDLVQEHACHRLQAALLGPHGLRDMLRPTTDHKPYYQALPPDPLRSGDDPAIALARSAWGRSQEAPWRGVLGDALMATRALAALVGPHAEGSIWAEARAPHPTGLPPGGEVSCADCAWNREGHCQVSDAPTHEGPGCLHGQRFAEDECSQCGACCHRGFDVVDLQPEEVDRFADLATDQGFGPQLARPGGHCVLLEGPPWRCQRYADRPRNCADLEIAGPACLLARQRAGLS